MTKYQAEVLVELELDGDDEAAFKAVDEIMQRAWDSDQGRRWIDQKWHFSVSGPGAVIELDGVEELGHELVEIGDLDDVTDDVTVSPAAPSAPSDAVDVSADATVLAAALRDLVGESCESHAEFSATCPTCTAIALLQVRDAG